MTASLTAPDFPPRPPHALPWHEVKRVLVVKLRHHGDVLLASPVISVLKACAPHVQIDALVYADTAPMLSEHPDLHQLITIPRKTKKILDKIRQEVHLARVLRKNHYDLVIHLSIHNRGMQAVWYSGARWSIAPERKGRKLWQKTFTDVYGPESNPRRHTVETHLDSLRRLGLTIPHGAARRIVLTPGDAAEHRVSTLLQQYGVETKQFIHLHPASRWFFKCWTIDGYAQLIAYLLNAGHTLVLTAAPDPMELEQIRQIIECASPLKTDHAERLINLSGQLNLKELSALSARASYFIGADSAPMHIAAAMQTPVIALFGPSGDMEWYPWQVPHRIVASQHRCRPCGRAGCGDAQLSECLTSIPVTQVIDAFNHLVTECTTTP